jgi:flavin reductase (DIM6/NTAB) family NADH-FMN oxidoreductase RutF
MAAMKIDPETLDPVARFKILGSCIVPRPIAFVSTLSKEGVTNLAPFSFFNGVTGTPPIVMVSVGARKDGKKDTHWNIEETGEFVVNVVVPELMDAVISSAKDLPHNVSEIDEAGLKTVPSTVVKPPRLADSPIAFECKLYKIIPIERSALILGRVVLFHIKDELFKDGAVDPKRLTFVGRLGGDTYEKVVDLFDRPRK